MNSIVSIVFFLTKESFNKMNRMMVIVILLCIIPAVNAQTISAATMVQGYSVAQKRLLAISTFQFANFISQNILDQDSIMAIACRITGMPFLLPYNEGFAGNESGGEDLINAGNIAEAKQLLKNADGERRIQLLMELAIWYLHQPGTHKGDLDSANFYIEASTQLANTGKYSRWEKECHFLFTELSFQKGNISASKETFIQLISFVTKSGNKEMIARAYHQLGQYFPARDSIRLVYIQKSLELYQQLQLKEKEVEVLVNISRCEEYVNMNSMERHLQQAISLMESTNFKHVLFAQNLLTFALVNQTKNKDALEYANAAMKNMRWSHIDEVAGTFYYRLGGVYEALGKYDAASFWFKKALNRGKNQAHLFWYNALFFAHALLIQKNKPAESLSMINSVTGKSPPITVWEKMQVFSCKGECFEKLNKRHSADENYMSLLEIATSNPLADPNGEFAYTYLNIANFYISQNDLKKALLFLKQGLLNLHDDPHTNSNKYSLLFKIDSLRGNFISALQIHILYRLYYDSLTALDHQKKIDQLTVKYAAEKKDQDIKILKQKGEIQQTEIKESEIIRDIMIGGTILLLIIVGLLISQYRLKQRTNAAISTKNAELQHLVGEKEWLLKEVHHRVKNNLHTVISLLECQASYLENDALEAVEKSQHRIYAMSLIHQQLYQSEDIKTIDMSVYLPEFIHYLDESFGTHYRINFNLNIEPLKFGASKAIPMALIINEAVTNSIKYAFPGNRKGIIKIALYRDADQVNIIIADNGIGIDSALVNKTSGSLGLKLINGLSEDIQGNLVIKNDNGTRISIVFKADQWRSSKDI